MSFVDFDRDDDWNEADARRRAASVLASEFPEIQVLRDRVAAQATGGLLLSEPEMATLRAYTARAQALNDRVVQTLADAALLRLVWEVEKAQCFLLDYPSLDPEEEGYEEREEARASAQLLIDSASPEVLAHVARRNRNPQPAEP